MKSQLRSKIRRKGVQIVGSGAKWILPHPSLFFLLKSLYAVPKICAILHYLNAFSFLLFCLSSSEFVTESANAICVNTTASNGALPAKWDQRTILMLTGLPFYRKIFFWPFFSCCYPTKLLANHERPLQKPFIQVPCLRVLPCCPTLHESILGHVSSDIHFLSVKRQGIWLMENWFLNVREVVLIALILCLEQEMGRV